MLWEEELSFPRDYILPLPNEDFSNCIGKRATYSDARGVSRALMSSLTCPGSEEKLLHATAIDYWTEHSDRAGLDSWLGALMVGSDLRQFVGRWAARGSEDSYVRTSTKIVENCQRFAAAHAKAQYQGGPDYVGEEHALEQLALVCPLVQQPAQRPRPPAAESKP